MKVKPKILQICLIIIAAVCASALAQTQEMPRPVRPPTTDRGSGSIAGKVVLPSGHPVSERIKITLSSSRGPGVMIYTDNAGGFGFKGLAEGMYTIEAMADTKHYEPVTQEVRLIRGMHVRLNIALKEKSSAEGKRPVGNVVSVAELDERVPAAAKKEFEKATKLANEDKIQEAVERFKRALDIYPNYLMARNDLGVQYLKLKLLPEAIEQFEAALEINPKVFNPRLNIGIALVGRKSYLEAIEHLNQAASIDGSSPAVRLYLGIASLEIDELLTAERELKAAQSLGGVEYTVVHFYQAQVHMKKGEREEALRELRAYLEKMPKGEYAARAQSLIEKLKSDNY